MSHVLDVRGLSISLPKGAERPMAVSDISFTVDRGETLCLVGESGSGKSVISHAIAGLLEGGPRVASGSINLEGIEITNLKRDQWRELQGAKVSMVFQEPMTALNPLIPVGKQIEEVMRIHGWRDKTQIRAHVRELGDQVKLPRLDDTLASYPMELSGGQRQRIMIAMALAMKPSLLIADEPTTALDVITQARIIELIRELEAEYNMGVLFITHDMGVVSEIGDNVLVMQKGQAVEYGNVSEILQSPKHPYTQELLNSVPRLRDTQVEKQMDATDILRVNNVSKSYHKGRGFFGQKKEIKALDDVSFSVSEGEVFGIIGESGSGKSTIGKCIVHLLEVDEGTIDVCGHEMSQLGARELREFRTDVQMVFQDPFGSLNPKKTISQILTEILKRKGQPQAEATVRACELLELVKLDRSALHRFPHEFSGGQRQRISIARALAANPKLIVADEAVSALDMSVQAAVLELFDELRHRLGVSIVFITHDLRAAGHVCDRIAVMQKGQIVEVGMSADLFAHPRHSYTRSLLASIPGAQSEFASSPT